MNSCPNSIVPVIVNASLNGKQTELLLNTLRKYQKKAIWYLLDNIKGINSSIYIHRIFLEEGSKLSIEYQRRVNPNLKVVVKEEIFKLLAAGIIYPILDNK